MWDQYMQDLTNDRVCLAPEVSRTHHDSGSSGATINQLAQMDSFDSIRAYLFHFLFLLRIPNIRLSDVPYVDMTAAHLTAKEYDNMMMAIIQDGIFVECRWGLLDYQHKTLLVYFNADNYGDNRWNFAVSWFGVSTKTSSPFYDAVFENGGGRGGGEVFI